MIPTQTNRRPTAGRSTARCARVPIVLRCRWAVCRGCWCRDG